MTVPGRVALFGSGETSASGRKIHDYLFRQLPAPVRVAILDTPAGFQPNAGLVAEKIKEFFERHLQNFAPRVEIVAARRRGGEYDPDDPAQVEPLLHADYLFAGPGSPTYAARHLAGTLALRHLVARHQQGATLSLASAAAIASGSHLLPVYEIFKAGADLHWQPGLDLFRPYGLDLAVVTHWNNREGGEELDTSRGYMGVERFERLIELLPDSTAVLGIDEHTACVLDFAAEQCLVLGQGGVTIRRGWREQTFPSAATFPFEALRR